MLYYKIRIYPKAQKDIKRIAKYMEEYNGEKILRKIYKYIDNLLFMPRIHKTIFYYTKPDLEYRRIVSGRYVIIYEIKEEQISILRIFNQKENYLNQRKFILREKSQKYLVKQ